MNLPLPRPLESRTVFEGRRINLEVQQFEDENGRRADREIVRHSGSVAILAIRRDHNGRAELLLEHNYRYPLQRCLIEIPAGTLDQQDESPVDCARRELIEETGFRALSIRPLVSLHPSPGILDESITIFLADELEAAQAAPEAGELIEIQWMAVDEVLDLIRRNEITDAKTIVAVLYARMFQQI